MKWVLRSTADGPAQHKSVDGLSLQKAVYGHLPTVCRQFFYVSAADGIILRSAAHPVGIDNAGKPGNGEHS